MKAGRFGVMVALKGESIVPLPLEEGLRGSHTVDLSLYRLTQQLY